MELVVERGCIVAELDHALALLQRTAELEPEVDEALELDVLNLKYDLSIVTKALQARQLAQNGLDVLSLLLRWFPGKLLVRWFPGKLLVSWLQALAVLLGFVLVSLAPSIKRTLNIYSGGPSDSTCDASCL
ncbi:PHM7_cyt domain-containing protein [Haematococcus lacustris]|uniref:PHM7_cyt domain-containing protein n=1 Tax=Haematococcus lacustris TaxID=44745 RepID=A0A699YFN8_HAELA|nr:PHM7_cyt domain-containing protein [Haematococcus lacustris]